MDDAELHVVPGAMVPILRASSRASWIGVAIDRGDDVAALDAGLGGRAVLLRLGDQRAGRLLQPMLSAMSGVTVWICTPIQPRVTLPLSLKLRDHAFDGVGRNGEGDADRAAGRREDRGVDADHLAVDVEGRAAGIALVDRRVDLDEIVIGAGADVAAAGRDDAGRDRAAQAERIADRQDPVADPRRCRRQISRTGSRSPSTLISARSVRDRCR